MSAETTYDKGLPTDEAKATARQSLDFYPYSSAASDDRRRENISEIPPALTLVADGRRAEMIDCHSTQKCSASTASIEYTRLVDRRMQSEAYSCAYSRQLAEQLVVITY
jgi:hypothetical protein